MVVYSSKFGFWRGLLRNMFTYFTASEINKISGSIRSPKTSIRSPTPSAAESQFRDLCRVPNYSELRLLLPSFEGPTMWTKKRISLRRKSYARNMNECWEPRAWRCAKSFTLSYEHKNPLFGDKNLSLSSISACPPDCQILIQKKLLCRHCVVFHDFNDLVGMVTVQVSAYQFHCFLRKTYINIIDDKHAQWWEAMKFHSFGLRNSEHGNLLLTFLVLSVSIHDIKKWTPIPTGQDIMSINTSIYTLCSICCSSIYVGMKWHECMKQWWLVVIP